jgi:hypothetical protein
VSSKIKGQMARSSPARVRGKRMEMLLADQIYSMLFGHLDDKRFRASKTQKIQDWLDSGSVEDGVPVEQLADEWREFDDDPNIYK